MRENIGERGKNKGRIGFITQFPRITTSLTRKAALLNAARKKTRFPIRDQSRNLGARPAEHNWKRKMKNQTHPAVID